jgi:hypothetical protein
VVVERELAPEKDFVKKIRLWNKLVVPNKVSVIKLLLGEWKVSSTVLASFQHFHSE